MSFRINIEWSPSGDESQTRKLLQLSLEEEIDAQNSPQDAKGANYTVEASDYSSGTKVSIGSCKVGPLDLENLLETAVDYLTELRDSIESSEPSAKTALPDAGAGDKVRSSRRFGKFRRERDGVPAPLVLPAGDVPDRNQSSVRRPILPSFKNFGREPQIDVGTLLNVERPTLPAIDANWGATEKSRRPIPWTWFALLGLLFGGACLWSLLQVIKSDDEAKQIEVSSKILLDHEEQADREATELVDRIDSTIRNYFSRSSVDELIPLVRHPERVVPLMREYYKDKPVFIGTVSSIKTLLPLEIDKRTNFWVAAAILSNGHKPIITVEVNPSGEILVDWKSLVCYQPMDWSEYARKRPEGTTMDFRVYGEPTAFNTHEFKDSKEWLCLRLTAYGSEEFLFGYAKVDSEVGRLLRQLLASNNLQRSTLTLRLTIPEGIQSPRGVIIEQVLNPGWIDLDPFETNLNTDAPPAATTQPEPQPVPAAPPGSGP